MRGGKDQVTTKGTYVRTEEDHIILPDHMMTMQKTNITKGEPGLTLGTDAAPEGSPRGF